MICPHGMTTPAACIECMYDGPVAAPTPAPEQMLVVATFITARHESRCARRYTHRIEVGDPIGYVKDLGWVCEMCAVSRG